MIQINSTLVNNLTVLGLVFLLNACVSTNNPARSHSSDYDVQIHRDFWGIPHIKGKTDIDVAFGIGLSHAEDAYDDLTELMPLYRGNNAVANGLKNIETDYLVRLLKVHTKVNEVAKKQLSPQILAMAKAYADGINEFAFNNPGKANLALHPIIAEDVIAGSYIQHLFFAGLDRDLAQISRIESNSIPTGSNAIAINGSKTISDSSFLLINSHQPLAGPVGWYELNVESETGWKAHGGNFPGSFLINVGFNASVGWGATVNRPDVLDIFQLTVNPANENEYLLDNEWVPFEIEEDYLEFKILGFLKLKTKQKFRYSQFGPVLEINKQFFALKHSTENSFREIEGWYQLSRTNNVFEFEQVLAQRKIPSFNFVVMDSMQNIGYFYNGRIPHRADAKLAKNIISASTLKHTWSDKKLVSDLPVFINPANGWIQSTNQNPYAVMGSYSLEYKAPKKHVAYEQRLTNRSHVANELLDSLEPIDLNQFIEIKFNNSYSINSRQFLFLNSIASNDPAIQNLITKWDRSTDQNNEYAGLGVCLMAQEWISEMNSQSTPSYQTVKASCDDLFKTIGRAPSERWAAMNTISRRDRSYGMQGSVDTLRAVYGTPNKETKSLDMSGGDGLFYIMAEQKDGRTIYGMHNFGASRNPESVHYSDQVFLFSKEALRYVPENL
ncbi:penicillin acylase family protein [Gammaproteobacteria bacterium]|nr:penicillin acylase family protein [Gammaproteobacteria bacterium]